MKYGEPSYSTIYKGQSFYQASLEEDVYMSDYVTINKKKYLYLYAPVGEPGDEDLRADTGIKYY